MLRYDDGEKGSQMLSRVITVDEKVGQLFRKKGYLLEQTDEPESTMLVTADAKFVKKLLKTKELAADIYTDGTFPSSISMNELELCQTYIIQIGAYNQGTRIKLRFIDSYRFMASSIDSLSNNLDDNKKSITRSLCKNDDEFNLITKKGVFPYLDKWEKFDDTTLPSKEQFYSKLNEENISDKAYAHALNVWQMFNIKTLREYSDLYLQTDVALLADVFESFRADCLNTYKLDPAHYYTLPGLSFSAMLRYTQIELELLTDPEMMLFIEQGIRGGLSQVSNRYGKANNRYMGSEYNPEEEESFLMYLDLNNMYGAAMREYLPTCKFEWIDNFDISILNSTADNSKYGYILEVDLDYPASLHHHHKDFSLAPVREKPPLETRMIITKVHRVLKFQQSSWLQSYIDLNTELRKKARSAFEKDLRKLFINAIYGKTFESVRTRKSIKLVQKYGGRGGARFYISKPNFHSHLIIDDLVIIEMKPTSILFD
ncbi:uncharacterized protein LOC122859886 [Aphidius gifuensis]|uniref:uncharacterized protein LOC122859886 n=1 Tax=Aphidius gifuensis TaxID=684658 RepID=UPI001CDCF25B|nr:uncharacterized protein LOC122859886 [Aphidius gifuensis]